MQPILSRNTRIAIFLGVATAVAGLIIILILNSSYRILTITPSPNSLPTSTNTITVITNRELLPLEQQPADLIRSNEASAAYSVSIEDSSLLIGLNNTYNQDDQLTFELVGLLTVDGESLDESINYTVSYVPFNRLDQEEQLRQIDESSLVEDDNPLLTALPYDQITFRINYILDESSYGSADSWQEEKDNYLVIISTFAKKAGVTEETYVQESLALRKEALQWITEQGIDIERDINISYSPSDEELANETPIGD